MSRMSLLLLVVPAFLVACLMRPSTVPDEWSFIEHRDGVDLYERKASELGDVAFRGVITTEVPLAKIVTIFANPEERPYWVYRHGGEEILEDGDHSDSRRWSETYWARVDMPSGITDRDYVLNADYNISMAREQMTADIRSSTNWDYPEQDCCIRAQSLTNYTFETNKDGETVVELIVETELNGRLSDRLIRKVGPDWPAYTLRRLVDHADSDEVEDDDRVKDWQTDWLTEP